MRTKLINTMRHFMPDAGHLPGSDSSQTPTGMENDPRADETVINQQQGEEYPHPVDEQTAEPAKIAPDNLADSIAYALDGSGPGPTNDTPNVSGHKVVTEGITGAGPEDEEENLQDWSAPID